MASIRRGYSDDFTLNNNPSGFRKEASSSVGIGTSVGQEALDVVDGSVKGQDLKVIGVSSFTAYEGFLRSNHQIAENTTLSFDQGPVSSLSGEIIVGTGKTVTVDSLPGDEYGPELITNGTFDSDTTGWTAFNAVISSTSNQLKVDDTANAGGWSCASQQVTTEPGAKYRLEVTLGSATEDSYIGINAGAYLVAGVTPTLSYGRFSGGQTTVIEFIAPEKITSISLTANDDGVSYFDNVSLKKINVPEEPRAGGSEIECLKVFNTFTPPSGGTNERPYAPKPGELYYNYDFKTIEFFDGNGWRQVDNMTRSGRAVFAGGYHGGSGALTHIGYVQISTFGNSLNFGDLSTGQYDADGHGNETRGIISAGQGDNDLMQYITIAAGGNAINFGDLIQDRAWTTCAGSSTRKLTAGGWISPASRNEIEYVEMSTIGNALDFGDLSQARYGMAGMNSPVKCVFAGGYKSPGSSVRQDTVNTASKGNAVEFGTMSRYHSYPAAGSSSTRGIVAGGAVTTIQALGSNIDMVTFASDGEHIDFGNLTEKKRLLKGTSSNTRMVMFGGANAVPSPNASLTNTIEYITIASNGNGFDFGDMTGKDVFDPAALSDSHGGLGGF